MEQLGGTSADLLTLSLVPFSSASCLIGPITNIETNKEVKETTLDLNYEPEAMPSKGKVTLAPPMKP
ncbi:hypothetical protein Taro_021188 [Colocasia esculenta]|uniref:Uncharacterized protein n=1 Tax=Colocasia esculenta TaxID=4460 RepID=A0A843V7G8_COLES|nr:hypothetical protein [Colocasia esculenta]